MKLKRADEKLKFYENSIEHLRIWYEENEQLGLKISKWLNEKSDEFDLSQLKTVTQYHIEISKVMYASLALLDKLYRNKERFEQWQADVNEL